MNLGLLISGELGNIILKDILLNKRFLVLFVLTDSKSETIISTCHENDIPFFSGNPRKEKTKGFLSQFESPFLILSVNYLFIIEEDVIKKATHYCINIHGSLLPKYRGRTPHVWAIINNETMTGITAHLIDKNCDEGDVLLREEVPILNSYTGNDLLNIFKTKYPLIVKKLLQKAIDNDLTPVPQDHGKATFFGKRSAEDGKIIMEWQKERIYNWVRAQAKPYPGAFCFINNNKIIIHRLEYSDLGFHADMANGLIIKVTGGQPFVKVQNGVLRLIEFEFNHEFKEGDILE